MARPHKTNFKLVVIDRDGTLCEYREGYIKSPEEWVPVPGALEAVALLNRAGWHVVMATNQPAIGRGVMDMASLNAINAVMHRQLAAAGARVDAIFFCPHLPEEGCHCHKPAPGLLEEIGHCYGVELSAVHAVGDALRDVQAAVAAGCVPHLVCTGEGARWLDQPLDAEFPPHVQVHRDLMDFARHLLAQEERQKEESARRRRDEAEVRASDGDLSMGSAAQAGPSPLSGHGTAS